MSFYVGVIDDEQQNINRIKRKARQASFKFVEVPLIEDIEQMVQEIIGLKVSALVVDYKLSTTKPHIRYTGVDLVMKLEDYIENYPSFILTAFGDNAEQDLIDVNKIYDKSEYFNDPSFLNRRINRQVENFNQMIKKAEAELLDLKRIASPTLKQQERMIELDSVIEKHVSKKDALAYSVKTKFYQDRIESLLEKTEKLLEEVEKL
ncbi:hypothetical protein [Bacillus sp. B-jedd]|uniref:hypothetical protein n=1 Tax=Bacillus sp. B-jedd TaxID=1476857 RepID=UPI0005155CA1|nr:hypothetical protein [Bacillus sp. B-jedd]CEG25309.1 hypothetical protein BN1002_00102 [Bacillus sp. B-jedd]